MRGGAKLQNIRLHYETPRAERSTRETEARVVASTGALTLGILKTRVADSFCRDSFNLQQ
jgi:hypothetical protein